MKSLRSVISVANFMSVAGDIKMLMDENVEIDTSNEVVDNNNNY